MKGLLTCCLVLFSLLTTAQISINYTLLPPIQAEYVKNDTTLTHSKGGEYYYIVTKDSVTITLPAVTDSVAKNTVWNFMVLDSIPTISFNLPIYATSGGNTIASYSLSETENYGMFKLQKYTHFSISIWEDKYRIGGYRPN